MPLLDIIRVLFPRFFKKMTCTNTSGLCTNTFILGGVKMQSLGVWREVAVISRETWFWHTTGIWSYHIQSVSCGIAWLVDIRKWISRPLSLPHCLTFLIFRTNFYLSKLQEDTLHLLFCSYSTRQSLIAISNRSFTIWSAFLSSLKKKKKIKCLYVYINALAYGKALKLSEVHQSCKHDFTIYIVILFLFFFCVPSSRLSRSRIHFCNASCLWRKKKLTDVLFDLLSFYSLSLARKICQKIHVI